MSRYHARIAEQLNERQYRGRGRAVIAGPNGVDLSSEHALEQFLDPFPGHVAIEIVRPDGKPWTEALVAAEFRAARK